MTHYDDRYTFGDAFCEALAAMTSGARMHVSAYWDSIGGRKLDIYPDYDPEEEEDEDDG